jgi:cytochrome c553
MRRTTLSLLTLVFSSVFTAAMYSQGGPTPREPAWAFPVNTGTIPAEPPGPKSLPGSSKQYTSEQIDDLLNPPDWYPNEHPEAPAIVTKGHGGALACGSCHLMSGSGHPESSDLTGLSADYIVQQMADFKSGARRDSARMNGIAKETTDEEVKAAAAYFASLKPQKWNRVVEAAMVPKTVVAGGRMRFVDPAGGMEPIGNRIITVPEDMERARRRDPKSGFVSYVPPGTLAKGKALVDEGGGKTVACGVCHGGNLEGAGNIPRLAGNHPIYTARQLYLFKDGTRNGADAALMKPIADALNDDDILAISAYLGSL